MEQHQYACYEPKHAIIFMDKKEKMFAYLQLDIECRHIITNLPERNTGIFCEGKFDLLGAFFRSVGVTHFKDSLPEVNRIITLK